MLILFHRDCITEKDSEYLRFLLLTIGSPEQFCNAFELLNRNRITSQKKKIVKEACRRQLRPFRFLINKN
jgi:hypothetical protein